MKQALVSVLAVSLLVQSRAQEEFTRGPKTYEEVHIESNILQNEVDELKLQIREVRLRAELNFAFQAKTEKKAAAELEAVQKLEADAKMKVAKSRATLKKLEQEKDGMIDQVNAAVDKAEADKQEREGAKRIVALKKEKVSAQAELEKQAHNNLVRAQGDVQTVMASMDGLKTASSSQRKMYEAAIEAAQAETARLEQEKKDASAALEKRISQSKDATRDLRAQLHLHEAEADKHRHERSASGADVEDAEQQVQSAQHELEGLQEDVKAVRSKLHAASDSLAHKKRELEGKQQELYELKISKKSGAVSSQVGLEAELAYLNSKLQDQQNSLKSLNAKLNEAQATGNAAPTLLQLQAIPGSADAWDGEGEEPPLEMLPFPKDQPSFDDAYMKAAREQAAQTEEGRAELNLLSQNQAREAAQEAKNKAISAETDVAYFKAAAEQAKVIATAAAAKGTEEAKGLQDVAEAATKRLKSAEEELAAAKKAADEAVKAAPTGDAPPEMTHVLDTQKGFTAKAFLPMISRVL